MKFLSLALLASAVTASPLLSRADQTTTKDFHLKTSSASNNDAHNNLYIYAYHTGAGLNDAVLSSNADDASKAFVNGTHLQFDLGTPFPWGVNMVGATNYGAWQPVEINTGYGTAGFSLENTKVKWSTQNGFGGWLVCDWVHNAPQLFYLYEPLEAKAKIPSSCSKVELEAVYL